MSVILRPPNRFVSIHNHSTFSPYDGLGHPQEHIDFCLRNGLDGWSLTDHGNGNGLAHAHGHAKKLYKNGQKFRQIFGVEFYFVPSLKDWQRAYNQKKADAEAAKSDDAPEDEEEAGLVVEDADQTRTEVSVNDIYKRYHLVVIAKNRIGLSNLFTLVKKSFKDGFYKFPRIDFDLLKQHGEGLVVSTACVSGDAVLQTSAGKLSLRDVVDKVNRGEWVSVLSYDESQERAIYKQATWGDVTRRNAILLQITLKGGKKVKVTPDHKVFTDKGWMEAQDLTSHPGVKILSTNLV
jgi:DNA polymerase III alpha subunit